MQLAVVVGTVTATVKDASLAGRKLALVRVIEPDGTPTAPPEVALVVSSAGVGERVLVVRGSAARQPAPNRSLATDLSIVAIVDDVTVPPPRDATTKNSNQSASNDSTRKVSHG